MKRHQDLETLKPGDLFKVPVEKLHPTQFSVGMVSAECKRRSIENKFEKGELEKFLCQEGHLVPVIIGPPEKTFYLTDHHHLCTALWRADIPKAEKVAVAYVLLDWSDKDLDTFWKDMVKNNFAWLRDEKGVGPLNPSLLPRHVGEILNDPFRTLSRWIRDAGCYFKDELKDKDRNLCNQETFQPTKQNAAFFIEFRWANFLRENVELDTDPNMFYLPCDRHPTDSDTFQHEIQTMQKALPKVIQLIGCRQLADVSYDRRGCLKSSTPIES